mgnify:CR=1 FL=1
MNFLSHFTFGIFTGLIIYYLTTNWLAAGIVFFIQILLILDFLFKKTINFEPLHTILAMLLLTIILYFIIPQYAWYVFFAYFTHLFLDIWVLEEIPLLYPFKKQLMYPIQNSEKYVMLGSCIGILILLISLVF